jgi:protein-disulfide isomerase
MSGEGEERRRKLLQVASAAVFLVVAAVLVLIVVNASQDSGGDPDDLQGVGEVNRQLHGIPQRGMTLGRLDAPALLVEFGDLKCPHCAAVSEEIIPTVIDSRVRDGGARIEFRNFPIIDGQSVAAGAALLAAGEQRRGWNFLEIFYRNQGLETSQYADDEFLTAVARAAGVADIARWNRARRSSRLLDEVDSSSEEAKRLGFTGTPSFAVAGRDGNLEPLGVIASASDLESALDGG